jgi:hypothetical protein
MSSVEIKITGVSDVKGLKKKPKRKRVSRPKKKGSSELKKRPEFFTTQFTSRPTYIERPPTAQPTIDYRPMFDKLMLQQLLLQNKGNNFREQEILATTTLAKNQPSISVIEVVEDEEKNNYKKIRYERYRNSRSIRKCCGFPRSGIRFRRGKKISNCWNEKQINTLAKEQQQKLSSLGIPAEALKDIQNAQRRN